MTDDEKELTELVETIDLFSYLEETDRTYDHITKQCEALAKLEPGWDIDGNAPSPSQLAIDNAQEVARLTLGWRPELHPDALGGVSIEYAHNTYVDYINCWNNGLITILNGRTERKSQTVETAMEAAQIYSRWRTG
jgi:hypothetical protein